MQHLNNSFNNPIYITVKQQDFAYFISMIKLSHHMHCWFLFGKSALLSMMIMWTADSVNSMLNHASPIDDNVDRRLSKFHAQSCKSDFWKSIVAIPWTFILESCRLKEVKISTQKSTLHFFISWASFSPLTHHNRRSSLPSMPRRVGRPMLAICDTLICKKQQATKQKRKDKIGSYGICDVFRLPQGALMCG